MLIAVPRPRYPLMARALQLAEQGRRPPPIPAWAVWITHGDLVVGEGWHQRAGKRAPRRSPRLGSRRGVYQGNGLCHVRAVQPHRPHPTLCRCADSGGSAVVVAMQDPNPLVGGQGLARLAAAGIATTVGVLEAEVRERGPLYLAHGAGTALVTVKLGARMGKPPRHGRSQWITRPAARADVQRMRAEVGDVDRCGYGVR